MKSHRLLLLALFLLATSGVAAPTVQGAPRWASDVPGCALSGAQSRYAVRALVTGTESDRPAALTLHDVRTGALPDNALGTFSLTATDGTGARLTSGRDLTFSPLGWSEHQVDGALTASTQVFTLAHNVFVITVTLSGVSTAVTLQATLAGTLSAGGGTFQSGEGRFASVLTLDSGEGRPFGVALGLAEGSLISSGTSGTSYSTDLVTTLTADGTVAYLLAFDDVPANAQARGEAALTAAGAVTGWHPAAQARWEATLAAFTPPQTTDADARAADALALAVLLNNELRSTDGALVGALPAKTRLNYFETRDSGLQALGAVEESAARAKAYLDGVLRGQLTGAGNLQAGLVPHRVDEEGGFPSLDQPSTTDHYSERPAFAAALRAIRDRGLPALSSEEQTALLEAQLALLTWWRTHRDWDLDLVLETNGGLESGSDGSPRFAEIWGSGDGVRLPVPEVEPWVRTPLNAVDVSSALYAEYLEASQLSAALGREEDRRQALARASLLAAQIDEATFGFWDDTRGGYFDYYLAGTERERELLSVRTPVLWAPLTAGAARELPRANRALGHLLAPAEFWRPAAIPSVAIGEASFDPDQRWRGAGLAEVQYDAAVALFRYGYETEAEALRQLSLATLRAGGLFPESFHPETGAGQGPGCFGSTAALSMALARNRHQEEGFNVERGGLPRARSGQLRRLIRLSDGQLLLGVSVAGSREVPVTVLTSPTQLFSDEPMVIELSDPHGLIGEAPITLSLPAYDRVTARWTAGPGAGQTLQLEGEVTLTARAGDRIELGELHFLGDQSCGCGSPGGAGLGGLALVIARLCRRRRSKAGQAGTNAHRRGIAGARHRF